MDHYTKGGWDYVVEAWSDGDILEYYSEANGNTKKAFKAISKVVKERFDYAQEISNA